MKKIINIKLLNLCMILTVITFALVGCSEKIEYTELQSKYLELCENPPNDKLNKDTIEKLIGMELSSYIEGKNDDLSSYTFDLNDEQLSLSTNSNTGELVFVHYNKMGEFELANSLKGGTDIGGYKPGLTGIYNTKNLKLQKQQLNLYLNN